METATRFGSYVFVAFAALALAGCKPSESDKPRDESTAATAELPQALFVASAPAGAKEVIQLKSDAPASGEVVIHGRIGGRGTPFVNGAAVFVLIDSSLKPCNELPADSCSRPWDYCCETPETLKTSTATIQVVDEAGKPIRLDLKGQHGLEPLAELTVAGEIARHDDGTLVINAKQIHVHARAG